MAEGQGFEPWTPFGEHAFQACALNHSAIPPAVWSSPEYVPTIKKGRKEAFRQRRPREVLGGAVCGVAGSLYAYYVGTVNARAFFFHAAFLTLAMHILGGMRSVTGTVVDVALISITMELIRQLESGPVILGVQMPELLGLSGLMLSVIIVLVMCRRSDGLMGGMELNELLGRAWERRTRD